MQTYYSDLSSIEQQTKQLEHFLCRHCQQTNCLISHGYIYKKRHCGDPVAVGKRVFCSNRHHHNGCGRTMQLYLDSMVRYLHYAGDVVVAFILAWMTGMSVQQAYCTTTSKDNPQNAYRWLRRFFAQLSLYRSLSHSVSLRCDVPLPTSHSQPNSANSSLNRSLLTSTMNALLQRFGEPLCCHFQAQCQRPFL